MKKLAILIAFMGIANIVMTYSCFEIQEHQFKALAFAVTDAIQMIDDNLNFEHREEN